MMNAIRKILGLSIVDYGQMFQKGAVILDVRTAGEYAGGHIQGSINIPVEQLTGNLNRLPDKQRTIITCCASGARSGAALRILHSKGYQSIYNGGGWSSLQHKLRSGRTM